MSATRHMTTEEIAALLTDPRVSEDDREAIRFFGCTGDPETAKWIEGPAGDAAVGFWPEALEENGGPGWYVYCGEYPDEGGQRLDSLKWDADFAPVAARVSLPEKGRP